MQLEIKLLLPSTVDYRRLADVLAPLYQNEESYEDFFFDFPSGLLTDESSVLRLRVPCAKPDSIASPTAAGLPPAEAYPFHSGDETSASGAHEFLYYCPRAEDSACSPAMAQPLPSQPACLNDFDGHRAQRSNLCPPPTQPSVDGAVPRLPQAPLAEPRCGKLVFKQKNTVQRGHQMNFTLEDKAVPPDVVESLLSRNGNPFDVLEAYASRTPAQATPSAAARIVERLREAAARAVGEEAGGGPTPSQGYSAAAAGGSTQETLPEMDYSSQYYGNVRYSAGTLPSQAENASAAAAAQQARCELVPFGSYKTTRKTYRYLQPREARDGVHAASSSAEALAALTAAEQAELAWRSRLIIRLDNTQFPTGESYEVEIPRIDDNGAGAYLDDIMAELECFLRCAGVRYRVGSEGKYARFICGLRGMQATPENVRDVKLCLPNANGYAAVEKNLVTLMHSGAAAHGPGAAAVAGGVNATPSMSFDGREGGALGKRTIATTDLDPTGLQQQRTNEALLAFTSATERHENYFFDGLNRELATRSCFLRLRRLTVDRGGRPAQYVLTLKENNAFAEGTQYNRKRETKLTEDVAQALAAQPGAFLAAQHEHNDVANTLWELFGLRTLCAISSFTTTRITVPWWSAQSQRAVVRRAPAANGDLCREAHGAQARAVLAELGANSSPFGGAAAMAGGVTQVSSLTQLQSILGAGGNGGGGALVAPPLLIHLDRTQYRVPVLAPDRHRASRQPFSQLSFPTAGAADRTGVSGSTPSTGSSSNSSGGGSSSWNGRQAPANSSEEVFERYEIEVTNIVAAEPSAVMRELQGVLQDMGVEWQEGRQTKLDQYFSLLNAVNQ